MNYRHAYHAGNFADVMKHIIIVRLIEHMKRKDKPFRFVDTHAGIGMYDLSGDQAQRSGEWRDGAGKLADATLEPIGVPPGSALGGLLAPYFDVLKAVNRGCGEPVPRFYPGAGEFARRLMRPDDRLLLNELHPEDARALRRQVGRDERVGTMQLDGWMVLKSVLPPKERRGIVLVDPPFEEPGEFERLQSALDEATSRFATGVSVLWYPIKEGGAAERFVKRMATRGLRRLLVAELMIRHPDMPRGLNGSGLLIHNPPYGVDQQLELILPWLKQRLGQSGAAAARVEWIVGE